MNTIHIMVGIPGSGKSTYAKKLSKKLQCEIIATDDMRNAHPDWAEQDIWPEAYRLVANELKVGKDVIFDATNVTPRVRKRLVDSVGAHDVCFNVACYYIKASRDICLKRVAKRNEDPRERYLPIEVIFSYAEQIIPPTMEEGFILIKVIDGDKLKKLGD